MVIAVEGTTHYHRADVHELRKTYAVDWPLRVLARVPGFTLESASVTPVECIAFRAAAANIEGAVPYPGAGPCGGMDAATEPYLFGFCQSG
ncbi:hypothetical protein G3N70_16465, partial [Xanthomonas hortorum pv. gardneri]|uniref:hypothetical protein n=1 Tax=Xanthomonas hortorum TaxID=56454 RepID=UPI002FE16541